MPDLSTLLGLSGTVLIIATMVPQTWRTCGQGQTAGLPIGRPWVLVQISLAWLGYGLYGGGPFQIITNLCTALMGLAILVRLLPVTAPADRRNGWWVGSTAAVLGAVWWLGRTGGQEPVGLLAAAMSITICAPQLLSLLRHPHRDSTGVSRASSWLQLAGCASWCAYGLLRGELPVWLPNLVILPTVAWTLLLLRQAPARTLVRS